jgi:hypothetical protein
MDQTKALIGPVRFCYVNLFKPKMFDNGDNLYSVCCMYPESDKKVAAQINAAVQAAIKKGIEDRKITQAQVRNLKLPVHSGTDAVAAEERTKEFDGMMYFNCGRPEDRGQPGIVDANRQPIVDPSILYSGCWGYVFANFYAYKYSNKRGVSCAKGLQHVMFLREDTRLDGSVDVDDAFKDVPMPEGGEELDDGGELT